MASKGDHWDSIFLETEDSKLGWYESDVSQTLRLMTSIPSWKNTDTFLVGAGTSSLVEELHNNGVKLAINDISSIALDKVKSRLGEQAQLINWINGDISLPLEKNVDAADVWIDRAVFHFLTEQQDVLGYLDNLRQILKVGGHCIFAEFSKDAVARCAGLDLHCYSIDELSKTLGDSFKLIKAFDHTYTNPDAGQRPYIYTLFQRVST